MIPVKFEAQRLMPPGPSILRGKRRGEPVRRRRRLRRGPGGRRPADLVAMTPGPEAMQAYRSLKDGSFEPIPSSQSGLDATGEGLAVLWGTLTTMACPIWQWRCGTG